MENRESRPSSTLPYSSPEKRKAWERRKRKEIRDIIETAKAVPCADCAVEYPYYVMTFDHVYGEKKFGIATAIQHCTRSLESVHEEIAKCEVVCMNCQALRHGGRCGPHERSY